MTKTIGVIGLGSIGMRHAKNLRDMGHHVWGCDPDMKKRLELGFDYTTNDIERIGESDAFIVASPTTEHLEQFKMFLEGWGKPIFMEKPIADEYAAEMKKILMVGYNLRFHSCVKKAKEWLDAGHIGRPVWSNFTLGQWSDKPPYLRDGVILNWSHEIDLCTYLLGPAQVAASSTRVGARPGTASSDVNVFAFQGDDMSDILLTHKNGCRSTVHLDYVTDPEHRSFFIVGSKGKISVDVVGRSAVVTAADYRTIFNGTDTWNDNYIEEMQEFLTLIDEPDIQRRGATGQEGLEVLKISLEVRKQAGLD